MTDQRRVENVHLENGHCGGPLDVADYAAAEPDPLHEAERELLDDLTAHHRDEIEPYLRDVLRIGVVDAESPRAVRLDRYGFLVDTGREPAERRWVRLDFDRPMRSVREFVHLLHPVLFHDH